jgi:hypothetical protein
MKKKMEETMPAPGHEMTMPPKKKAAAKKTKTEDAPAAASAE